MKDNNILIGKGLKSVRFGMTMDQVKEIFGEPDEMEKYTDDDDSDNETITYHYDEQEISMSFDEMTDWLLVTLAVSSVDFNFEGLKLIGLDYDNVMKKIAKLELGEAVIEDLPEEEGIQQKLVSFDDVAVSFWFEDDILSEIIWGPVSEEDME